MAKQGAHYVKKTTKQPYLKKWEWITLICILGAVILGVGGYFAVRALTDDSLSVKGGKAVTGEGDWLLVNEGSSSEKKYYKYGKYDFSSLDAEVKIVPFSEDENLGEVYVYPNDDRYDYACVYAIKFPYDEISATVQGQMGSLVIDGAVGDLKDTDFGGRPAKIYSYYSHDTLKDEDGIPLQNESGEEIHEYNQVFSCYIKSERGGCVVARIGYKCKNEEDLLTDEQGYAYLSEAVSCLDFTADGIIKD